MKEVATYYTQKNCQLFFLTIFICEESEQLTNLDDDCVDGGRHAGGDDLGELAEELEAGSVLVHEADHHQAEHQNGKHGTDHSRELELKRENLIVPPTS